MQPSKVKGFVKQTPNHDNFLPLYSYLAIAEKMIKMHAKGPVKNLMLNDDEAIAWVSYIIMKADWRFDPSQNTTIETFRSFSAAKGIKTYINRFNRQEKFESIDYNDFVVDNKAMSSEQKINRYDSLMDLSKELGYYLGFLSENQKICIEKRYMENKNYQEIAEEFGFSAEKVRQNILTGLELMREIWNGHQNRISDNLSI
jgi:DNA-directed RNA polymerase specialized sigma24 family protein